MALCYRRIKLKDTLTLTYTPSLGEGTVYLLHTNVAIMRNELDMSFITELNKPIYILKEQKIFFQNSHKIMGYDKCVTS